MCPKKVTPSDKPRTKTAAEALASLMRLCARAEKCEADARRLMRGWGVAENEAEGVLQRLVKERFIDDSRYAAMYVREKSNLAGWGIYKIRAALQRKQIAKATIEEALAQLDTEKGREQLLVRLQRKMRTLKAKTPYELKTKLIRYGLSLGYPYDAVMAVVPTCLPDTLNDDEPCNEYFD